MNTILIHLNAISTHMASLTHRIAALEANAGNAPQSNNTQSNNSNGVTLDELNRVVAELKTLIDMNRGVSRNDFDKAIKDLTAKIQAPPTPVVTRSVAATTPPASQATPQPAMLDLQRQAINIEEDIMAFQTPVVEKKKIIRKKT